MVHFTLFHILFSVNVPMMAALSLCAPAVMFQWLCTLRMGQNEAFLPPTPWRTCILVSLLTLPWTFATGMLHEFSHAIVGTLCGATVESISAGGEEFLTYFSSLGDITPFQFILICLAGAGAEAILAAALIYGAIRCKPLSVGRRVCAVLAVIQVFDVVINLLPIETHDGAKALEIIRALLA